MLRLALVLFKMFSYGIFHPIYMSIYLCTWQVSAGLPARIKEMNIPSPSSPPTILKPEKLINYISHNRVLVEFYKRLFTTTNELF